MVWADGMGVPLAEAADVGDNPASDVGEMIWISGVSGARFTGIPPPGFPLVSASSIRAASPEEIASPHGSPIRAIVGSINPSAAENGLPRGITPLAAIPRWFIREKHARGPIPGAGGSRGPGLIGMWFSRSLCSSAGPTSFPAVCECRRLARVYANRRGSRRSCRSPGRTWGDGPCRHCS